VFDLRYHVASLAAVFLALVIGLLVGVALASHGLGNTERKRLEGDLRNAQAQNDALTTQLKAERDAASADKAFADSTYEVVMANRLQGKRIAVLFIGSVDGGVRSAITRAIADADGGGALRVRAVKVPIDSAALTKRLSNRSPFFAAYAGRDQLTKLGHALGQEFAAGGDTPLWNTLQNLLVEEQAGTKKQPADGVVVVRTAPPQTGATALFLKGLYSGLRDVDVPAVGVERTADGGSAIEAFQAAHLSTVNDIDERAGKLALAILLSDVTIEGDFGAAPAATWLPTVPAVPTTGG
jgi:copper transport outer membrane protein MctB